MPLTIETRDPKEKAMIEAACKGDLKQVKSLIEQGVNINLTNYGEPLLVYAALYSQFKIIQTLQEAGAVINVRIAACLGDNRHLQALLEAGEDVEGHKYPGSTTDNSALVLAAWKGHTQTVRLLLAHGADINAANIYGETALIKAVQRGHKETVLALFEGGADVNLIPYNGEAALLHARNAQMARLLIDYGADVNRGGSSSSFNIFGHPTFAPLIEATTRDDLATIRLLLEKGADVNGRDDRGCTALMMAAAGGCRECVELLLAFGTGVNYKDKRGWTAITWAQEIDNVAEMVDMVERLKQAGAKE